MFTDKNSKVVDCGLEVTLKLIIVVDMDHMYLN